MFIPNPNGVKTLFRKEMRRFFRIPGQTIIPPILTSVLYILVFGQFLASRIQEIVPGVGYIDFMVPGLLMMNVIGGSFMGTSFGLFMSRFQNSIQEVLVAPLSYLEMGIGYVIAGAVRGVITGLGVYAIAIFFTTATIAHVGQFLYFLVMCSLMFSAIGALIGIWAKSFEHINIPNTFILLPLSFLGGVFHSTTLLPPALAFFTKLNPIFYMVNGIRGSMIGVSDTSTLLAGTVVGLLTVVAFLATVFLFQRGYRLKS